MIMVSSGFKIYEQEICHVMESLFCFMHSSSCSARGGKSRVVTRWKEQGTGKSSRMASLLLVR